LRWPLQPLRECSRGALIVPGVSTATDITRAAADGLELLKFFPAEVAGGTKVRSSGLFFVPVWADVCAYGGYTYSYSTRVT
jgi:2-keto-3-deoxy-6-phosphogluconate aldolase